MKQIIKEGTKIYYGGDMANREGFGVVVKVKIDRWGTFIKVQFDDGRIFPNIPASMFSAEYLGHGGTRFVTRQAYDKWRKNQLLQFTSRTKNLIAE